MTSTLTADEILNLLKLEPNATCGFVRLTFVSEQSVAEGVLSPPFAEARPVGSALYFMVTPGAPVRLHRIRNDQLYHYNLGDPLEGHCRTGLANRPAGATPDSRKYLSHCPPGRTGTMVPGREHGVAGRGACRR
jgi:predicted cupin superfamily sugar epimerase